MSAKRDAAIKLFGKTIPLQPSGHLPPSSGSGMSCWEEMVVVKNKATSESNDKSFGPPNPQEKIESSESSEEQPPSADNQEASIEDAATEEQPDDPSDPKQKKLKKPDKILPCPRCKSVDTKFCYFNNYNVNQPRHFCKNCQRYWTAGGSMRNVPVGAGRRKNKNLASQYRQIAVRNSSFLAVGSVIPDLLPCTLKPNGTVLCFGSDVPLHGSMASPLNVADKNTKSCIQDEFHHQVEGKAAPRRYPTGNGDEHSSRSSDGSPNSEGVTTNNNSVINNAPHDFQTVQCFNGAPLMYPWIPAPCAPSFPVHFNPAATYWSCAVPPGTMSVPWVSPPVTSRPTSGQRPRDGSAVADGNVENESGEKKDSQERCIWTPKTRIDDPEEAAKSSICAMLGARNGKADGVSGGGLFKAFHQEDVVKNHAVGSSSQFFHANPAAMSRSLNFQESS